MSLLFFNFLFIIAAAAAVENETITLRFGTLSTRLIHLYESDIFGLLSLSKQNPIRWHVLFATEFRLQKQQYYQRLIKSRDFLCIGPTKEIEFYKRQRFAVQMGFDVVLVFLFGSLDRQRIERS